MKLIIAGSRGFADYGFLCNTLETLLPEQPSEVVSGCAAGADVLGERWAKECGIPVRRFPADWRRYGKRAGYVRNLEMALYVAGRGSAVLFWDGESRGTRMMVDLAIEHIGEAQTMVVLY